MKNRGGFVKGAGKVHQNHVKTYLALLKRKEDIKQHVSALEEKLAAVRKKMEPLQQKEKEIAGQIVAIEREHELDKISKEIKKTLVLLKPSGVREAFAIKAEPGQFGVRV